MVEIIERIPELENKLYIIGGPRKQALGEALRILLRTTDQCFLSTEFFCLKDSQEAIKKEFDEQAKILGLKQGSAPYFTTIKNGNLEAIDDRIYGSHKRRFIRLTFIDSLEAMHQRGCPYDRDAVIKHVWKVNPIITVSDHVAELDDTTTQYLVDGETISLTIA